MTSRKVRGQAFRFVRKAGNHRVQVSSTTRAKGYRMQATLARELPALANSRGIHRPARITAFDWPFRLIYGCSDIMSHAAAGASMYADMRAKMSSALGPSAGPIVSRLRNRPSISATMFAASVAVVTRRRSCFLRS
jgi:hypothetical protein